MLTKNEVSSLSLSPTKKDFVQIWNELLEVAGKLSERWDPTSTNESDPGIVILKAVAGIADKLNYNIDKNTLEAFMPTAAQEDSMRKLCDMLGYSIKYYRSAVTPVTISYRNMEPSQDEANIINMGLTLPKFSVITNSDQDISYFTLADVNIATNNSFTVECMEGQLVKCESTSDNNIITINQISENNRFYLPETYVAENGVFIYNVYSRGEADSPITEDGEQWERVDNLNIQSRGAKAFKFGYDSYEGRPYVEFPEDYSELFGDGIFIYYTRTNGVNGNISEGTLSQIEFPVDDKWSKISTESFQVVNSFPATNGANIETIKQAYSNYKKTVGTFETMVTCRDYMNKIYSMIDDEGKPYVSNILVTDIRNDLNRAITICSCDDAGIFYKEMPISIGKTESNTVITRGAVQTTVTETDPVFESEYYTDPIQTADSTISEAVQYGDPVYSEPEQVGDPIFSEPVPDGDPVVEEILVASTANKPVYITPARYVSLGSFGSSSGYITRYVNWVLGTKDGVSLFNDDYSRDLVKDKNFVGSNSGEVSAYKSDGSRSTYWLITQNGVTYTTTLEIDWVKSTNTTSTNTVTKTVTNNVTKTVNMLQTETVNMERTRTVNNVVTKTVTNTSVDTATKTVENEYAIDHFDLVLYPFKRYSQISGNKSILSNIRDTYDASFEYSYSEFNRLASIFENDESFANTMSHNVKSPRPNEGDRCGDIVSINNYLRLSATIATNYKVTAVEQESIIHNIKVALANAFNMRELDFGEEIPFDSIVDVIESADSRIRIAAMNEPALYTTFSVLDSIVDNVPIIKEYAVASAYLTESQAAATGRLDGTFNTKRAKEIYNKLAVRNVLAGRVPLFKYDNTFETSFSEGAYMVTDHIGTVSSGEARPAGVPNESELETPTAEHPFTIYSKDNAIYTGQLTDDNECSYKKISVQHEDNVIKQLGNSGNNYITDIEASLKVSADDQSKISNITLAPGEFIKFRAPNFTTLKTYPAYVNYHLKLATETKSRAVNASAKTLYDLLNEDVDQWSTSNPSIRWQKVLDYFGNVDKQHNTEYKKKITMTQTISKYTPVAATSSDLCTSAENLSGQHELDPATNKCKYCGVEMLEPIQKGPITITINNKQVSETKSVASALATSGCVKLISKKPTLLWDTTLGDTAPGGTGPNLDFELNLSNPFVSSTNTINDIESAINSNVELLKTQSVGGSPALPTTCAWSINFEFEYVPFEPASLTEWENFIKSQGRELFGFTPASENGNVLWRVSDGGYQAGRYVQQSSEKLLKFGVEYFTLLDGLSNRLYGIYIADELGRDAVPAVVDNDAEYKLGSGEYLYIEYTPSTTTEESSTSQALAAIKEIHGPGTIIKPSGFTSGLIDSTVYSRDVSPTKSVVFEVPNANGGVTNTELPMFSFGASEQVEIRDFANVTLDKNSFRASPAVYVYKNFNDCSALEEIETGGERSYTLKDGEYIFYTDSNKTEFAYVGAGTEVILSGGVKLAKFDILTLSEIFDGGIQAIPWSYVPLKEGDSITFQEYQYVVLGAGDTLSSATLLGNEQKNIDSNTLTNEWQWCSDVQYTIAGEDTRNLPGISAFLENTSNVPHANSNGWEICSTLELDVSPSTSQTLRKTEDISSSITLMNYSGGGNADGNINYVLEPKYVGDTLSVKTNLACQTSGSRMNINNLISNPDKLKGFEFKIFTEETPSIVKTEPNSVVPHRDYYQLNSLAEWSGEPIKEKEYLELWSYVDLKEISPVKDIATPSEPYKNYDRALKLSASLLKNTYGVFCVYLNYTSTEPGAKTWIEAVPGTDADAITMLNRSTDDEELVVNGKTTLSKLYLQPGINCIRVGKTGDIFIKSSNAQGVLYFDDIKLVNCEPVDYILNGQSYSSATLGLNIEQLGYQNPEDIIDKDVSNKLISDRVAATLTELLAEEPKAKTATEQYFNNLGSAFSKIDEINSLVIKAESELQQLSDNYKDDNDTLSKLFEQYRNINDALTREKALRDALKDNSGKNIIEINKQLAELLDSLTSLDEDAQKLQSELDSITEKAKSNLDTFTDEEVLSAFPDGGVAKDDSDFKKLQRVCAERVEIAVNKQLADLASRLELTATSSERSNLLEILTNLYEESHSGTLAELREKINALSELINRDEGIGLAESVYSSLATAEYSTALSYLSQLYSYLNTDEIKRRVSEIAAITIEDPSTDSALSTLVEELSELINELDVETGLPASVNALIGEVENKVSADNKEPDAALTGTAKGLQQDIISDYQQAVSAILNDINTLVDRRLNDKFLAAVNILNGLKSSEDKEIAQLIDEIESIRDTRKANIDTISKLTTFEKSSLPPYSSEAIVEVWTPKLKQIGLDAVNELFSSLNNKIAAPTNSSITIPEYSGTEWTNVLNAKIDIDAFGSIESAISNLVLKSSQRSGNAGFINGLSVPNTPDMTTALDAIRNLTDNSTEATRVAALIAAISSFMTTTNAADRHQYANELQAELDSAIELDGALYEVTSKLLCPSILLFDSEYEPTAKLYKDAFYDSFISKIESIKDNFANNNKTAADVISSAKNTLSSIINNDCKLAELTLASPVDIAKAEVSKNTILPSDVITNVKELITAAKLLVNITNAKSAAFFGDNYFLKHPDSSASDIIGTWIGNATLYSTEDVYSVNDALNSLKSNVAAIENATPTLNDTFKSIYDTYKIEEQLLADVRRYDEGINFYYSAPVETTLAIDFNESVNTLMNPYTNYDINNINNSFVISKLDIDYLDTGLQIARSSRLG